MKHTERSKENISGSMVHDESVTESHYARYLGSALAQQGRRRQEHSQKPEAPSAPAPAPSFTSRPICPSKRWILCHHALTTIGSNTAPRIETVRTWPGTEGDENIARIALRHTVEAVRYTWYCAEKKTTKEVRIQEIRMQQELIEDRCSMLWMML
jgi:hypothetical protein